jgi:hypothetical protein
VVFCGHNSQCAAVAELLRDPASILKDLQVNCAPSSSFDAEHAGRSISESLAGNTHLKMLQTNLRFDRDKILCDTSSIESISNSNHTLESISFLDTSFQHLHNNVCYSVGRMRTNQK